MDGANCKIPERVADSLSGEKLLATVVEKAVAHQLHFNDVRHAVQEWVRQNAVFPCRTYPTADGICVSVTDTDCEGFSHFMFPLSSLDVNRFHQEYEGGW